MFKNIFCLLIIIMMLLSCSDKDSGKIENRNNINIIEDDEYIKNIVKDSYR